MNVYKELIKNGFHTLAFEVKGISDNRDDGSGEDGGGELRPSNPSTYVPPDPDANKVIIEETPEVKNVYTVKVSCNFTMEEEVEATDEDNAKMLAPGVAYDLIQEDILPLLDEQFQSFNMKFDKFRVDTIKEEF